MTRIRTIKPEFWTDEKVVELTAFARLLFIGLWNFCDDEGRMVYSPRRIKMQIFPADALDIEALFSELTSSGLVQVYVATGAQYLQVQGFARHQKIDKRSASRLPPPPSSPGKTTNAPRCGSSTAWVAEVPASGSLPSNPADSPLEISLPPTPPDFPRIPPPEGNGREGKGKEGIGSEAIASGASPPLAVGKPDVSSVEKLDLWAAAKSLLQDAGMPARQCGPFVGKLARDFGSEVAMVAARALVAEQPVDPMAYLQATCQRLAGLRTTASPWYATEQGVLEKGRELSLLPHPGESLAAFRSRIEAALPGARDPPGVAREQRSRMLKASLKRCDD